MQLTNYCELEQDLPADSAGVSRNDFDRGYADDDTFERPTRRCRPEPRANDPGTLTYRRATSLDDDELPDVARHFGNC